MKSLEKIIPATLKLKHEQKSLLFLFHPKLSVCHCSGTQTGKTSKPFGSFSLIKDLAKVDFIPVCGSDLTMVSPSGPYLPNGISEGSKYHGRDIRAEASSTNFKDVEKSFYLLLSDFEAAYDHIPRIILWKCIFNRFPPNFNATVFLIMQSMYQHTESFITNI